MWRPDTGCDAKIGGGCGSRARSLRTMTRAIKRSKVTQVVNLVKARVTGERYEGDNKVVDL